MQNNKELQSFKLTLVTSNLLPNFAVDVIKETKLEERLRPTESVDGIF